MYKNILKYLVIVCAVLAIGQVEINRKALGLYFVMGVKAVVTYVAEKLVESPWVANVTRPKGLTHWFPMGEMNRKPSSVKETRASVGAGDLAVSKADDEEVVEDEDEDESNPKDEFSEVELEADDSAVMSILP
jgi:hypothetical protein